MALLEAARTPSALLEEGKFSVVYLYKLRPSASLNGVERNSLTHIASPAVLHTRTKYMQITFSSRPAFISNYKKLAGDADLRVGITIEKWHRASRMTTKY